MPSTWACRANACDLNLDRFRPGNAVTHWLPSKGLLIKAHTKHRSPANVDRCKAKAERAVAAGEQRPSNVDRFQALIRKHAGRAIGFDAEAHRKHQGVGQMWTAFGYQAVANMHLQK